MRVRLEVEIACDSCSEAVWVPGVLSLAEELDIDCVPTFPDVITSSEIDFPDGWTEQKRAYWPTATRCPGCSK